jgi:hypothetical protein
MTPRTNQKNRATAEPPVGNPYSFDGTPWPLQARSRRLRIGDMMAGVVMAALGLTAVSPSELSGGARWLLGAFALASLGLLWAQWGLASVTATRPAITALLGALASIIALLTLAAVIALWFVFPQAAAVLSVMMLLFVIYMTTWD